MTFLAPGFFFASLAVAAGIVALHFIVTRQPRAAILPTARFVPDLPATATARAARPSDLLLMLLRVLLVLAAGAGLAKPILKSSRGAEARVILADVSRSTRDAAGMRDSVRSLYRDRDALVVFDSSARLLTAGAADSIASLQISSKRGNLTAALIAAMRAGSALRDRADSIELIIVSPFAREEMDAATDSVRHLWPGRARIVRVDGGASKTPRAAERLELKANAADPLQVTASLAREDSTATGMIVRDISEAASGSTDRALIEWPSSSRPRGAVARATIDTIGGVTSGDAVVISTFARRWSYPADSLRGSEVVARWIDGEPAAIETATPSGCSRSVAIPVNPVGDLVIGNDFVKLVVALSRDCSIRTSIVPAPAADVDRLAGRGSLASRAGFEARDDVRSDLGPWLIGLAIAAAIAELFVRRRKAENITRNSNRSKSREAKAA
jgi:hypothetical protein